MPEFSARSKARLTLCDKKLQDLMNRVIERIDITVLCGHRCKADQDRAVADGKSKLRWPKSKHNSWPAQAVDIAPWPINWNDIEQFQQMGAVVKEVATEMGIPIEWGGDWKMRDYPHVELV